MSLINAAQCRRFMLDRAASTRNGKFTRVSKSALDYLEAEIRRVATYLVDNHISKGKTISSHWGAEDE